MNLELFIAKRLLHGNRKSHSAVPIIRIAQSGIAAGVCVMLMALFITSGFKKDITDKIVGFSSHIEIVPATASKAWSSGGAYMPEQTIQKIRSLPSITKVSRFINKPGILRTAANFNGVVMHGLAPETDTSFFHSYIKAGRIPDLSSGPSTDNIVISENIATRLRLETGDKVIAHFIQSPPRSRPFKVCGIYRTGFNDYDESFVLCDMRILQKLNGWEVGIYSGLDIKLDRLDNIMPMADHINSATEDDLSENGWSIRTMYEKAPDIFDWLSLLDMNVSVILILLVLVAGFNMISSLIIIIIEKSRFIGIMKSIGMKNVKLRKLFLWIAFFLIGEGMLWGNLIAFLFAFLQKEFHIITLDSATYYMSWVPIDIQPGYALLLNIGVIVATISMLIIPTAVISRIEPVKVIKFD